MKHRIIITGIVVCCFCAIVSAAPAPSVGTGGGHALQAASVPYLPVDLNRVEARQREFVAGLAELAENMDATAMRQVAETEGESIEAKIAYIAVRWKTDKARYSKIVERYSNAPLPDAGEISRSGVRYPRLDAADVNEDSRWVWEFLCLFPQPEVTNYRLLQDFHENLVLEALKRIDSPKTQVLYEYCFVTSARLDLHGRDWTTEHIPWETLLDGIARQQTVPSVERMLRCLDTLKDNPKFHSKVRQYIIGLWMGIDRQWMELYSRGTLRRDVIDQPSRRLIRQTWSNVIHQIPMKRYSLEDQALLKRTLDLQQE